MNRVLLLLALTVPVVGTQADDPVDNETIERVPLQTVVPAYPEKARRARVEGEVEVCFEVDREGRTSRIAVRRSTNRVFERPSIAAVRASKYRPLPPGQKPSGIKTCRTFRFKLTPVAVDSLTD